MSTRATIKFFDRYDTFYIYRHCDGIPGVVLDDAWKTIRVAKGRWSGSEVGQLVSLFFAMHGSINRKVQRYEMTTGFHGDESHYYHVEYRNGQWMAYEVDPPTDGR